jgi:competence protein ComEC
LTAYNLLWWRYEFRAFAALRDTISDSLDLDLDEGASTGRLEDWLQSERDRLPLLVPVALGLGVTIWQMAGNGAALMLAALCAGAVLLAASIGFARRTAIVLAAGATLVLSGYATIAFKSATFGAAPLEKPWIGQFNARIKVVEDVAARGIVRYVLDTGQHAELPQRIRVNVDQAQHRAELQPGAIILVRARLMPPPGPALPRSYDFARTAWFAGIGATGRALGNPTLITPAPGVESFWSQSREGLARHISKAMEASVAPVGAALLIGSRGGIVEEDAEALRNAGMAHLLSVSGLHVTAVVGGAFLLFSRLLSLWPWFALRMTVPIAAAGAAAVIAICYTLLTGAEVPTIRACVASLLILLALILGREALSLRLLAAGACTVLMFWPESLAGPSFQLSFAAVGTIIILHETPFIQRLTQRREEAIAMRLLRNVASLLITGIAIELVLAPIGLFHFHKSGVYGAIANIAAIPLTTFLIMPMQIIGLLLDAIYSGMGAPAWWVAGRGVAALLEMAHWVSGQPGAVAVLPAMPVWAFGMLIISFLGLAIFRIRWRLLLFVPLMVGAAALLSAPRPDILVTGDGKHVAIVDEIGAIALLRPRAGDYAVSLLSENAATQAEPMAIDDLPYAECGDDSCIIRLQRGEQNWSVLATRSNYYMPAMELASACARVDIVISERWLPYSCKPRWLKADRNFLAQSGGLAIHLVEQRIETVSASNAGQPWSQIGKPLPPRKRKEQKKTPEQQKAVPEPQIQ